MTREEWYLFGFERAGDPGLQAWLWTAPDSYRCTNEWVALCLGRSDRLELSSNWFERNMRAIHG